MNNTIAGNKLADTLELLILDMKEDYNTRTMQGRSARLGRAWPTTVAVQTLSQQFVQKALAAIHLYRTQTGTQRVRPAAAVID